ncbi:hypothetical protein SAMN06296056_11235 [Priestia filamentosa]|nr:hypothetical protein SAMN06296056_11235 [Priestia filamentosa]
MGIIMLNIDSAVMKKFDELSKEKGILQQVFLQ